jgi:hypothetical protein
MQERYPLAVWRGPFLGDDTRHIARSGSDILGDTQRWLDHGMEARSWAQPLAPQMTPPDAFLHLRLRIADAWRDESGEWALIADLPSVALWSILGYLRWHGPRIQASDGDGRAHRDVDAYLASRPLVAAIDHELTRRGMTERGEALAMVRAIGPAPWEIAPPSPIRRRRA